MIYKPIKLQYAAIRLQFGLYFRLLPSRKSSQAEAGKYNSLPLWAPIRAQNFVSLTSCYMLPLTLDLTTYLALNYG